MQITSRGNWSGAAGFILAAMGSAVGLGNVWRYPYVTGQYGGAAFILLYVGCVLAIGVPLLLAEFVIGRKTQRNPVGALKTLRSGSSWVLTGWLGFASSFVILSYYAVVGGWVMHYVYLSLTDSFTGRPPEQITVLYVGLSADPWLQTFWLMVLMFFTIVIVSRGASKPPITS